MINLLAAFNLMILGLLGIMLQDHLRDRILWLVERVLS